MGDNDVKIKAKIKEKGRYKIIDRVTAKLNEKEDRYEGLLSNINIRNVIVDDSYVRRYEKLLAGGIWCILTLEYWFNENSSDSPFKVVELNIFRRITFGFEIRHLSYFIGKGFPGFRNINR